VSEARLAGVSSSRLRAKDLDSPFHGVRVRAESDAPHDASARPLSPWEESRQEEVRRATAFAAVMGSGTFFAGRTAAVLQGAAVDPGPELVVAVFAPGRAPRHRGVRGIHVMPELARVGAFDGMRVTTPASTWAMLGAELSVRELVALGDSMVRVPRDRKGRLEPHRRLAAVEQLERAVLAGRRVGIARLREALHHIRVGSASPLETDFRLDAVTAGLPEPELDVEIRDRGGRLLGISEVVYRSARVVVEIEGDHHRVDRTQWNRDIDKYAAYAAEGWEVVRLTAAHIRGHRPRGVGLVRAALLRRGWDPA
jgi:hypothetical protein